MSLCKKLFDKIITLLFIFLFLQMPFFMTEYMNHLEGHLEELKLYRMQLVKTARANHLSLEGFLLHFQENPDKIVSSQGKAMQETLDRYDLFASAFESYYTASSWQRPFTFLRNLDRSLMIETASSFQIGFSLSFESLMFMLMGLFVGALVGTLINPFKKRASHDRDEKKCCNI